MAETRAASARDIDIVLKPVSHPELGDIRIADDLFAIGRTEEPFASYPPAVVDALSRRHARIFREHGQVYIAELGSKNGTTVGGVPVEDKPCRLRDGDEVRFGGELAYRVQLGTRAEKPETETGLCSVTLTPERSDLGLQPIVVASFPFLISKNDDAFGRYKEKYPHQVNYLSRRHAHIFLKGGMPFVEDLSSTNGTFVDGKRLDEHAAALAGGEVLAFGGHHFVYRVSLQREGAADATVTKHGVVAPADAEKTTFVAAADSFLDIFCVDHPRQADDEADAEEAMAPDAAGKEGKRGRLAIFAAELLEAFAGRRRLDLKRALRWGGAAAALAATAAFAVYLKGAPEREVQQLLASGQYAEAAQAAGRYLERRPDHAEIKALATEALLKAHVPRWLALLKAGQFEPAAAAIVGMRSLAANHAELQALIAELEWMGRLEEFVGGRGGVEAPIRIYADEDRIRDLLKRWDDDPMGHQRAFDAISSHVPEFRDPYAEALSHLRRLRSDDSVYLAAIERLKASIAAELNRDNPEALEAVFKEYAEKYPRLGGLDGLRADLKQYLAIEGEVRARNLGRLTVLLAKGQPSTPPFRAKLEALAASGQLPPADVVRQYEAAAEAWREGEVEEAFAALQQMPAGPWAEMAGRDLAHKKAVAQRFAELQKARGAKGYDGQLLSFYESLDPDEDIHFVRAIEADLGEHRDLALRRAQELMNRSQALWGQYRENGAIAGEQRLETAISGKYRSQARLLADANETVHQGLRIYAQLKAETPGQWRRLQEEIAAETELQRRSLLELRTVLEPGLLKAKLALIGGPSDEQGKSP